MVDHSGQRWNFTEVIARLAAELDEVLARAPRPDHMPVRQRQVRLAVDEVAELAAEYQAGLDMRDLAIRWNVSRHTVADHLRRAGVDVRRQGLPQLLVPEATRLYLAGWSLARLGDRFSCDAETVRQALKQAGVQLRRPWER